MHRSGALADAVGASISIPGLVPPLALDGRRLVDGGVLNNLPVDVMAAAGEGPIVAVDVTSRVGPRPDDAELGLGETLVRTLTLGSVDTAAAAQRYADLVDHAARPRRGHARVPPARRAARRGPARGAGRTGPYAVPRAVASRRMIRIVLVDDQPLVRGGLRMLLEGEPDVEVVGEADDGAQGVELAERLRPDLVLMDIRMPVLDGIGAAREIRARGLPARVLLITTFDPAEYAEHARAAGASGVLLKDETPEALVAAVRAAVAAF